MDLALFERLRGPEGQALLSAAESLSPTEANQLPVIEALKRMTERRRCLQKTDQEPAKSKAAMKTAALRMSDRDAFDLIFLPINSICHLEANADLEACLQSVRRHLAPGGVFVIDVFNPSLEILTRDPQRWHDLGEYPNEDGRVIRLSERNRYDKASQINAITWRFEWEGHAPVELALRMRQYFPQELDGQVTRSGLRILAKYGNYGEKPFQSDSHQQLIVAALPRA